MGNTGVTVMWTSRKFLGCHEGAREGAVDLVEFAGHFPISPYLILIFGFFFFYRLFIKVFVHVVPVLSS